MYLLASPCIQDPSFRAAGITHERDHAAFLRFRDRCIRFGIQVRYLPCPETRYLGKDRAPATYSERLDNPEFRAVLDQCEGEVREMIAQYGYPSALVGVDSSPTCGVNCTWSSPAGREAKRGGFLALFPDIPAYDVYAVAAYRVYLAGPLFSEAERLWNLKVAELLRSYAFEVYLPQEIGDSSAERDKDSHAEIFEANLAALDRSDLVIAILDGSDADSGTAWEMGYAFAKGIPVYGLRTDFRMVGKSELVNLMLEQSAQVATNLQDLPLLLPCPIPFSSSPDAQEDKSWN